MRDIIIGEIKNPLCLDSVALANLLSSGIGGAKTPFNTVLLRRPLEPGQYLSIRYTERLAEAGIEPSVGSRGDSYDNAMAESIIGLFKT